MRKINLTKKLILAIRNVDIGQIKELLASGADPNTVVRVKDELNFCGFKHLRPLTEAVLMPPFLETGTINPNSKEVMTLLLEAGADLNSKTRLEEHDAAVHIVADCGCTDILNLMLQHNLDVNLPNFNGSTPLHCACMRNQIETVKILIGAGANINAKDDDGLMPIASSRKEVKELLLRAGATYQEMPPPAPNPFL